MLTARFARQACLANLRVQSMPLAVTTPRLPLRGFHSRSPISFPKPSEITLKHHATRAFATSQRRNAEAEPGESKSSSSPGVWSRLVTFTKYSFLLVGSTLVGVTVLTTGIFLHDAFTYNEMVRALSRDRIPLIGTICSLAYRWCTRCTPCITTGARRSKESPCDQGILERLGKRSGGTVE